MDVPSKTHLVPKGRSENDHDQKRTPSAETKHSMIPTISAASKVSPSRKKALTERNDTIDTHLAKVPIIGSKSCSCIRFGENVEKYECNDEVLLNYASPRPKYLRYKPDRRQEILLRRENEVNGGEGEGISSFETSNDTFGVGHLSDYSGSLTVGSQEGKKSKRSEEVDESDEELEEEEEEEVWEERLWGLKGVLKLFLLLVVLAVSISYISSMNSSSHSTVVEAVRVIKERYLVIQEHAYEFVKDLGTVGLGLFVKEEPVGFKFVDLELLEEEEMGEEVKMREVGDSDEVNETDIEKIHREESESSNMVEDEVVELDEFCGETKDLGSLEIAEIEEGDLDEAHVNGELEGIEINDGDVHEGQGITSAFDADLLASEFLLEPLQEEIVHGEVGRMGNDINEGPVNEILSSEDERSLMEEGPMKNMEMEFPIWKALIAIYFSAITYLVLGFQFKIRAIRKETSPAVEPCSQPVEAKQESSLHTCVQEKQHSDQNFAPLVDPKPLNEKCKEICQIRAPSVELLGEFVVGEMIGSSVRSCDNKSRIIESEVSSHSLSTTRKGMSSSSSNKAPADHGVPTQPAFSDISTSMSTPVFEKSSTKNQIVSKGMEDGNMGAMKMVATPIRRSSRIRSRAPR